MNLDQTAVLLFTRTVSGEVQTKNLFGKNQARNTKFISALNAKARQTLKASGLDYFVWSGNLQTGDSFAERYENGIKAIFQKGYKKVIAIGNDSPELKSHDLLEIANQLGDHNLVYGVTKIGGIYTLGLTEEGFENFDFESMAWETKRLATDFNTLAHNSDKVYRLNKVLGEFNTQKDVKLFLAHLYAGSVDRRVFGALFQLNINTFNYRAGVKGISSLFVGAALSLRGPPEGIFSYA